MQAPCLLLSVDTVFCISYNYSEFVCFHGSEVVFVAEKSFILKGDIIWSKGPDALCCRENAFLVCEEGICRGVFGQIPDEYAHFPVEDLSGRMIVPGLYDLHIHAPQYPFRGLGMDLTLLDWLDKYAFPEESRYGDAAYAAQSYALFAKDLLKSPTARACIFGTIHTDACLLLMDLLERGGFKGFVGKVNMDRNSPDYYIEESPQESVLETVRFILEARERFEGMRPIITPRFTPSCTDELMQLLGLTAREYGIGMQSHLSEMPEEVSWVKELCPQAGHYIDTYKEAGLLDASPAALAHCVWSDDYELSVMKENGVFAAHCPQSNMNLASGIASVRDWLDMGVSCGLGTDIAGGSTLSLFRAMTEAMQVSRLLSRMQNRSETVLSATEVFWMGTRGGGAFFGKCGAFEDGYAFDALVLDETSMPWVRKPEIQDRLERYMALSSCRDLLHKYVAGRKLF